MHLPIFLLWLLFLKYTRRFIYIDGLEYLLGKGYKSALYLWGKNIARVFLYRLIVFSYYSLGPEYSFVKKRKDKSFFNRNTCGQQEKNQWLGQRWVLFLSRKKTRGNPNFPLRLKGNSNRIKLSHNLKKVDPTLLPCCEKAFYSCISGEIYKYFPIPIT